ncbi:ABC transporter ATP-binding protein [Nocardiopsis gilva YIM 90087]|uniref:ABC transporter ATP-binding protein n=1 Tax=Nocardiopsis gilva YIM 90087 TaxID=1235441 RepID=A0A223S9R2_9ACTN|nr:ATP-binding cassette domain-containing protein [Nocardiopsis gilva]ASU84796.1 ABC transporter ATP-binding protein [Nocardiopsis gilva YIM 90087]
MNVESTGAPDQRPAPPAFSVTDAVVAYERTPVLRGVTFDVPAGQTLAILGPNGSGKSTLMRAMLGITPLVSGHVEVHGTRLNRFRDWARIGYVPQRLSAGGGVPATVREVVASGQVARRRRFRRATPDDHSAVANALASVGLADHANDSVHELSGGQQQRVLIARALAGRPDTFVLDEPMAGVDSGSQQALADTIRSLGERGTTVVLVLHELGPLEPLIQRSLVLSEGRIAHDGHASSQGHDHIHPHAGEAPAPTTAVPDIEVPRRA